MNTKYDEGRVYTVRCPSCHRFMNVAGLSLNTTKLIRCWNCKVQSSPRKWVIGGQRCLTP